MEDIREGKTTNATTGLMQLSWIFLTPTFMFFYVFKDNARVYQHFSEGQRLAVWVGLGGWVVGLLFFASAWFVIPNKSRE